jgi:hypothetical protein
MPNYVRTRLSFSGEESELKKLQETVKRTYTTDDGVEKVIGFSFQSIIPMPEDLAIESGSLGESGMRYLQLQDKHPLTWKDDDRKFMEKMQKDEEDNPEMFNKMIDLGRKYMMNLATYGYRTWYEFCNAEWNTKWDACEVNDEGMPEFVEFETAWDFCYPVVKKLSEMFPTVKIDYKFADEDFGYNCGFGTYINGKETDRVRPEDASKEAYEIVLSLHPEYEDELVYDAQTDTYKWVDDDDTE